MKKQRHCTFTLTLFEKAIFGAIAALFLVSFTLTSCSQKMYGTKAGAKGCGVWHPKKFKA